MPSTPQPYHKTLQRVNHHHRILQALTGDPLYLEHLSAADLDVLDSGAKAPSPGLEKKNRNIRHAIPPEIAEIIANDDHQRARTIKHLSTSQDYNAKKHANKIGACNCAHMILLGDSEGDCILMPYRCSSRLCPSCARLRSQDRAERLIERLSRLRRDKLENLKHIVLTIKNCPAGELELTITNLLQAWRQFRRQETSGWNTHVSGYAWTLEITYSQRTSTWHPHIHILAVCDYWPAKLMHTTWAAYAAQRGLNARAASGLNIDAIQADNPQALLHAAVETSKYTLKPLALSRIPSHATTELFNALRQRRLVGAAGDLQLPPPPRDPGVYRRFCGLKAIIDPEPDAQIPPTLLAEVWQAIWSQRSDLLQLIRTYDTIAYAVQADQEDQADQVNLKT